MNAFDISVKTVVNLSYSIAIHSESQNTEFLPILYKLFPYILFPVAKSGKKHNSCFFHYMKLVSL